MTFLGKRIANTAWGSGRYILFIVERPTTSIYSVYVYIRVPSRAYNIIYKYYSFH